MPTPTTVSQALAQYSTIYFIFIFMLTHTRTFMLFSKSHPRQFHQIDYNRIKYVRIKSNQI